MARVDKRPGQAGTTDRGAFWEMASRDKANRRAPRSRSPQRAKTNLPNGLSFHRRSAIERRSDPERVGLRLGLDKVLVSRAHTPCRRFPAAPLETGRH